MAVFLRLSIFNVVNTCSISIKNSSTSLPARAVFCGMSSSDINTMDPHASKTVGELSNTKKVKSLQCILQATNSWEQCWVEDVTPWDLGKVTPIVADLVERDDLPTGRVLVPGCGSGHDVFALASVTRHVTGLDISSTAIERACKLWMGTKSSLIEFVCLDFFTYEPGAPFDLILDYTFFCALVPSMRPLWGSQMAKLLAPEGELITIMFPMDTFEGGPPYAVSLEVYEKALQPHGFKCTYFQENTLAVGKRKGREFLGRWRRMATRL